MNASDILLSQCQPALVGLPAGAGWPPLVRKAMLHVCSLAHWSVTYTRSWAADSKLQRVRLAGKLERAENEIALLREELRIKDARMARIPAKNRPHYAPVERMGILELKAVRGWNLAQTAAEFMIEAETAASWLQRLDDPESSLVRIAEPINKYPQFVRHVVQRLKVLCPLMGKKRIAETLARAGLSLSTTTVGRCLRSSHSVPPCVPANRQQSTDSARPQVVTAKYPNHVWHIDLTVVPTSVGFWTVWFPFTYLQVWPFCWWVAVVIDHFSRQAIGFAVFKTQPSSEQVRRFLSSAMKLHHVRPKHLISDRGTQFDCSAYRKWCRRCKIQHRYGAVGKYGSIAVIERFIRSMKTECTRRLLIPMRLDDMRAELVCYITWYNEYRPHQSLEGKTPQEVYSESTRAPPDFRTRGADAIELDLVVSHHRGKTYLPIVELRQAA